MEEEPVPTIGVLPRSHLMPIPRGPKISTLANKAWVAGRTARGRFVQLGIFNYLTIYKVRKALENIKSVLHHLQDTFVGAL